MSEGQNGVHDVTRSHVFTFNFATQPPEFIIPRWSEATEAFWSRTLSQCRAWKKVLAIGAGLPRQFSTSGTKFLYEFGPSIAALRSEGGDPHQTAAEQNRNEPFDNTVLVLGSERTIYRQRVPVPVGMWRPFATDSVPLLLSATGVVKIGHQLAAILICYEQLLPWPVFSSMVERPTALVGVSITFWFNGTAIPRYQQSAMQSWAHLFHVPLLLAVNS